MKTKIVTTTEKIGPAKAQAYLTDGAPNRRIRPALVKQYASAMTAGKWPLTHQGIAFNEKHQLCDGQHRMMAIVKTGLTLEFQVSRYQHEAPMALLDSGYSRSCGDRASLAGIVTSNASAVLATLNAMARIDDPHHAAALQVHDIEARMAECGTEVRWAATVFPQKQPYNALIRGAFAYCHRFAPVKMEELAAMIVDQVGYAPGSAAHTFVKALHDGKLPFGGCGGGGSVRTQVMSRIMYLIRAHVQDVYVPRAHASQAAVDWAVCERAAIVKGS